MSMRRTVSSASRKPSEIKFPGSAPDQRRLPFELSLIERYTSFLSIVHAAVSMSSDKQETIAAACDYSPSEFNRRLHDNENDPGHPYPMRRFEALMDALDAPARCMILDWLEMRYRRDPDEERAQAIATVSKLAPMLERALAVLADGK